MELFLDVLGESLVDTAKMLPFLFLAYLFIEYVETRHGERIEAQLAGGGKLGFLPGAVLGEMGFFQPVVAAAVGLIPNCAASVLLTQLYVEGALRFSSLVAGLCTGAGVGLAVLWRANPSWKQNLFITGLTWACGAFLGVAMQLVVLLAG